MIFFAISTLGAATDINEKCQKDAVIVSPNRCLAPERGYIANEFFAFVCIRPDFAEAMAPAYGDSKTMKYLGDGSTAGIGKIREWFL